MKPSKAKKKGEKKLIAPFCSEVNLHKFHMSGLFQENMIFNQNLQQLVCTMFFNFAYSSQ